VTWIKNAKDVHYIYDIANKRPTMVYIDSLFVDDHSVTVHGDNQNTIAARFQEIDFYLYISIHKFYVA